MTSYQYVKGVGMTCICTVGAHDEVNLSCAVPPAGIMDRRDASIISRPPLTLRGGALVDTDTRCYGGTVQGEERLWVRRSLDLAEEDPPFRDDETSFNQPGLLLKGEVELRLPESPEGVGSTHL